MKIKNPKLMNLTKKILGDRLTYKIKLLKLINHLRRIREKDFLKEHPEAKEIYKYVKNPEVCLDVGANYGVYSFYLSKKFPKAKIYSFEPYSKSFYILKNIKNKFNLKNVFLHKIALGNENVKSKILVSNYEDARATISKKSGETIFIKKLDDFVKENKINCIDFIKIDVEGFEKKVIEGSIKSIKKFKPVILMEVLDKNLEKFDIDSKEIINFMRSLGYRAIEQEGGNDYIFIK